MDKKVERSADMKSKIAFVHDEKTKELVGIRVSFVPPAQSEEEHFIEQALFTSRSVSITQETGGVAFEIRDAHAIAQGRHDFENFKRNRDGKPSLEEEAAAKVAAEKAAAEPAAKDATEAGEPQK